MRSSFLSHSFRKGIILSVCTSVLPAAADNTVGQNVTASYQKCVSTTDSMAEEGNCLDEELAWQEMRLRKAYGKLLQDADSDSRKLIEKAQTAWMAFRDSDCEAQAIKGGSAAYNSHITCLIRLTANRAVEMDGYGAY